MSDERSIFKVLVSLGHSHSIVSCMHKYLKLADLLCRHAKSSVKSTAKTFRLRGDLVEWTTRGHFRESHWEFDLQSCAVIDFRLLFDGQAQDEIRLADISALPNPRRAMTDLVDPRLARLEKLLLSPAKEQAEDFEAGVGWLFHLLAFAPIHTLPPVPERKTPACRCQPPSWRPSYPRPC
jgi:hypothetical protein